VIGRHTHPQAERELPPSPASTGIDYLKLLRDKRDAELGGQRIDYASLAGDGEGESESDGEGKGKGKGKGKGEDRDTNHQEGGQ
jgi:hypothetical protein